MGETLFRFVEKDIEFGFGNVLTWNTETFVEVELVGNDCEHVVNGNSIRDVLKTMALHTLWSNLGDCNPPKDESKIDFIVTWNASGYVVKLAWVEQGDKDDLDGQ